jgi:photosystem II stability/assembly factor-like uncharacterized protein
MSGRVTAIDVVESNPNEIYIGTASGGLWKTESGGLEWNPLFDEENVASIGALCIYQAHPDIIWAGTGEGNPRNSITSGYGIYKSIDGGITWELKGLEKTRNIHRVIIDPTNPDIVYVGAIGSPWGPHPERGVYKTTDGGQNWEQVLFTNESSGCADLVMDPANPNKLIAAMWEHQRWPWFFNSGGEGSGLYITWDGGKNWKKMTDKDGLPEGMLGRMGLAIAGSDPNRVYALIESNENALYRSDNGGLNWRKMADENIGNRPFYYYDIFCDPNDPDRLYTLYSGVNKSEDGGATFKSFMGRIHPDHHAWYIHPSNSDYMIDGNDGGLAITTDRGATWRFITNLPLGQFYHVNYDMEFPYNVCGGLQDNGSWIGPSTVLSRGGIQYYHWQILMGGDGFDVVPDSLDSRFGYGMSQGGNVSRYDKLTGMTESIKPLHPEGLDLRFHWNSAIAHDPVDLKTIYFGSQFVHKSSDQGRSWDIISPDLTTNNPEKLKQNESGGLTYDVTGAENHCTILAISPSPANNQVIWVGTDDGNLQLTTDGGKTWTNLIANIKEAPECAWIPVVYASNHDEGEAFVVINNYRQNDFTPYLFHTTNFGKSWKRIADDESVWGYCLSVVQDPVEPDLVFLGTEYGLYFSLDRGQNWNRWTNGYPTVSTMDLKIHPREHDLIIGTFGRSLYILDDIRPLRDLASEGAEVMDKKIHLFPTSKAYRMSTKSQAGVYSAGNGFFSGQTKRTGALIKYSVDEPIKARQRGSTDQEDSEMDARREEMMARMRSMGRGASGFGGRMDASNREFEPVKIDIINMEGKKIQTVESYPKAGVNVANWSMDEQIEQSESQRRMGQQATSQRRRGRGGIQALPGRYKIVASYGGERDSTFIDIDLDPRIPYKMEDLIEKREVYLAFKKKADLLTEASNRLNQAKASLELIEKQIPRGRGEEIREIRSRTSTVSDTLTSIMEELSPPRGENPQRATRGVVGVQSKVQSASRGLTSGYGPVTGTQKVRIELAEATLKDFLAKVNRFFEGTWVEYKEFIQGSNLTPFTDGEFKKLEW